MEKTEPPSFLIAQSRIRIVALRKGDTRRVSGQDVKVYLIRPDGEEVDLTKECALISASWRVDSRSEFAVGTFEISGVEIDAEGVVTPPAPKPDAPATMEG